MRIKHRIFLSFILVLSGWFSYADGEIFIRDEVSGIAAFQGVMEGLTVGQGSAYIQMNENERDFFSRNLYPKYYPLSGNNILGSGHWGDKKIGKEKIFPSLIQYRFECGKYFLCIVIESDKFHWIVTITHKGNFIDAVPIYGWQSESDGEGFKRKTKKKIALESDIFSKSKQLLPDIHAYSPQSATKFAFGISDANLLCSRFAETSYVPHEHLAYEQIRLYRLNSGGKFEIIQEGSCVLSDDKISQLGLTELVKSEKSKE